MNTCLWGSVNDSLYLFERTYFSPKVYTLGFFIPRLKKVVDKPFRLIYVLYIRRNRKEKQMSCATLYSLANVINSTGMSKVEKIKYIEENKDELISLL